MKFSERYNLTERRIITTGSVCLVIILFIISYEALYPNNLTKKQLAAITYMEEMIDVTGSFCLEHNIPIDTILDPSKSGLIGPEWTEMTTTLGHLEAKRTTIQPEMASMIVGLLEECGVKKGDTIAFACSGSFPGLLLATISASKAIGSVCKTIISLGSSSYGANREEFNILDIYSLLYENKLISDYPTGISLGGEGDEGNSWESSLKNKLRAQIDKSGFHFIHSGQLKLNVDQRDSLLGLSTGSNIKVLINSGGAMANIGTSTSVLNLKPGILEDYFVPEIQEQGIIHRAMINNIPVIHLLNIKGLAQEYGLKWDPVIR